MMSIPDQKRQGDAYCQSRGYQLVETYVEPGASATNDRRPEFQRMIEAGISKPASFDVVVVHSFSRFFRDHFELEFYVRKLAKNGFKLVSITQEMGDDPMHVMMRQIMALFDEYQSKENARQGFWKVADKEVRIMGSKSDLLRTLAAASGVKSAAGGVRSSVLKWRRGRDSNPRDGYPPTHFPGVRLRPLGHPSSKAPHYSEATPSSKPPRHHALFTRS